jgi:hypothetical protein
MKIVLPIILSFALSGCAVVDTAKKYWPRSHDPVMFNQLANVDYQIENINCDQPTWDKILPTATVLTKHAEWRGDPQTENLKGLQAHIERMNKGGSKTFCELGKRTARQRVEATKKAWEGR